jgi:hypothetical protein
MTELSRRPCPCGKAEIVEYCEPPDHLWPSSQWHHYSVIECPECDAAYLIRGSTLIRRSDYEAQEQQRRAAWEQEQSFLTSPDVVKIFHRLAERLDQEPSVAAVYRLLRERELLGARVSENTFRRHWRGGADWIRMNGSTCLLRKLIEIGSLKPEQYPDVVRELERLSRLERGQ